MMTGRDVTQFEVSPLGVTKIENVAAPFTTDHVLAGLRRVMSTPVAGPFGAAVSDVSARALTATDRLGEAFVAMSLDANALTGFDVTTQNRFQTSLAQQLRMVVQLIVAGQQQLGLRRQVFFVELGGFDVHSDLQARNAELHAALDHGIAEFTQSMRLLDLSRSVTLFTASDFGRALYGNGNGSDHGWGGHHFIVGDAVAGNRVVGRLPQLGNDGPDDLGAGRAIPTTAVGEYAASVASWMGVAFEDLDHISPNLARFERELPVLMKASAGPETPTPTTVPNPQTPNTTPTTMHQPEILNPSPNGGLRQAKRLSIEP